MSRWRWRQYPLRVRLTAWYLLLLGLMLLLFSSFLYIQLKLSLFAQLDAALKLTSAYAKNHLDQLGDRPGFAPKRTSNLSLYMQQGNFTVRLITVNGRVWDGLGNYRTVPIWVPETTGYHNVQGDQMAWRIYSLPIQMGGARPAEWAWLQVAQPLTAVREAEARFLQQVAISLLLVLLIAGWGGWWLAHRALRPIDQMTRTAQAIGASNLTHRLAYHGPPDEVGRLAMTFDQMLDRIQAAFNRERRFTADVSHELRTPLTVMKGQIGVTLSQPRQQSDYEHRLRDIEQGVDRLIRLTNDLLFLARLDQGQLHHAMEVVNLSLLLEAIGEQVQVLIDAKQVNLITKIDPELLVMGNPDHLIRLFLNLLDNAVKHTPFTGEITIKTTLETSHVDVVVHNTGVGILPEHLPHLFERFYRVERARDRSTGGAGLGLAIANEIAHLHRGRLAVLSEIDQGTWFTVKLPIAPPH
jgi:heavy metal sensor kinase